MWGGREAGRRQAEKLTTLSLTELGRRELEIYWGRMEAIRRRGMAVAKEIEGAEQSGLSGVDFSRLVAGLE